MLYLIDSTVQSPNRVMFKAVDFFERYGVKYKILYVIFNRLNCTEPKPSYV
nr:MAG TPA: hypothetical protein [Caudoviricetes sp.]